MNRRPALVLAAVAALVLGPACERIPPSVSIPGYGEKKAEEKKAESAPVGGSTNPPSFFHGDKAAE
jgi:hypothetical protein